MKLELLSIQHQILQERNFQNILLRNVQLFLSQGVFKIHFQNW